VAKPYLEQLSQVVSRLESPQSIEVDLEARHFFSGAALYADQKICAILGPDGLALKLPEDTRQILIGEGQGAPFRFFPNGPIKRGYVLLSDSTFRDQETLQELIKSSISYVEDIPAQNAAAEKE